MDLADYKKLWTTQENQTICALANRCAESGTLKNALAAEIDAWREITQRLQVMSNRAREAIHWTKIPLEINHEIVNLLIKAHQDIPDYVMRTVKDEANAIIERSDELYKMQEENRKRQMEANKIRDQLEELWSDKKIALDLDHLSLALKVDSRFPTFKPLAEGRNLSVDYNPEGDSNYRINETIKRSQAMRDLTLKHLSDSDRLLAFTATNIQKARDDVIANVIKGRRAAIEWKDCNMSRLQSTHEQKVHMQKDYLNLRNAIHDNNRPLMLAETRLDIRAQKPNMDQEEDQSNARIKDQLHTIHQIYRENIGPMKDLKRGIQDSVDEESDLLRSIELVNNKLINSYDRCIARGHFYPTTKQLLGYE